VENIMNVRTFSVTSVASISVVSSFGFFGMPILAEVGIFAATMLTLLAMFLVNAERWEEEARRFDVAIDETAERRMMQERRLRKIVKGYVRRLPVREVAVEAKAMIASAVWDEVPPLHFGNTCK
jgi:hypothetical protein